MSKIKTKLICITFIAIFLAVNLFTTVNASSYDGVYDYRYNYYIGGKWPTITVEEGFTISDSIISNSEGTFSGTVSSSGAVSFTGPCPYGDPVATFTGVIYENGTGKGTYRCTYNHVGSWSVTRVSGGSFSIDGIFNFFADLGGIFGGDDEFVNATIGMMMFLIPFGIILGLASRAIRNKRKNRQLNLHQAGNTQSKPQFKNQKELGYQSSPTQSNSSTQDNIAPIGIQPNAHVLEPSGQISFDSKLPSQLTLRSRWTNDSISLSWDELRLDGDYQLDKYVISRMQYGPNSTSPTKTPVVELKPDVNQWSSGFKQTYQFNTRGDTEGYVVEAIIKHTSSMGQTELLRVGAMSYAPFP